MAVTNLSMFRMLKNKMQWHQARQTVLAENVANADTPDYNARDLKTIDFKKKLKMTTNGMGMQRDHQDHFVGKPMSSSLSGLAGQKRTGFETTPEGNGVVLEEQMMKVAANQMDFQTATSLYTRSLGLIKTAIGRR